MPTRTRKNVVFIAASLIASPLLAQSTPSQLDRVISAQPFESSTHALEAQPPPASAEDMQKMMAQMIELSKLNENHRLLASLAGSWTYSIKSWMDPKSPPIESKGTATRKPIMDGRYFVADFNGKFKMPGADGKMKDMDFKGMSIEGYDNVKQKFFSSWVDNMGTGTMMSEGTYDPATKTFTYTSEYQPMPGMNCKVREVLKITDRDHHEFEFYEDRGQGENKSMEISYARKK